MSPPLLLPPSRPLLVARAWAVVFAIVGLGIAVAPEWLAAFVTRLAGVLHVPGVVDAPGLLHTLAVSLMACITVAAWTGDTWRALLVAKVTSTLGFTLLVARGGPAWLLCAGADAFVAATLVLARRPRSPPALLAPFLRSLGGTPDAARAWSRAVRLPPPLDALFEGVAGLVEWVGPALVLGRPTRASRLPPAEFDRLQERMLHSPSLPVRGAMVLLRAPLGETAWASAPPGPVATHPLDDVPEGRGDRFDFVVIGSGAGGGPVAMQLAEAGRSVAVIEAGRLLRPDTSEATVERHYLEQGTLVTLEGAPILAASALGGTMAVNSGTCLRPLPERLRTWDALLGTHFADGGLDPWLEEAEAVLQVATPPRSLLPEAARRFEAGLAKLGRGGAFVLPRNAPACEGSGLCCFGCPTGAKMSGDRAFLPRAVAAGAQLFPGSRVVAVREAPDGVDVTLADGRRIRAGQVIVAGGAIGTPALLRASRLGDRWRRAGDSLRLHPATKVLARFPDRIHDGRGVPQGLGWRTAELDRVTFEGIHVPASTLAQVLNAGGAPGRAWMEGFENHASFGLMVHDRGEGQLRWFGERCVPRYHLHPDDGADLITGMRLIARAFLAAGADRVLLPLLGTANEAGSIDELDALQARREHVQFASFHPQGTAGMGRVVDPDLRLLGTSRIHVCDASVLPASPGANPQVTIVALSLRLADRLLRSSP